MFVHGSSYHGAAYHELAVALSRAGVSKVYLPNLRGHHMSGRRRGDVDYVGQLEDDIADLISMARDRGQTGEVTIGIRVAVASPSGLRAATTATLPVRICSSRRSSPRRPA